MPTMIGDIMLSLWKTYNATRDNKVGIMTTLGLKKNENCGQLAYHSVALFMSDASIG